MPAGIGLGGGGAFGPSDAAGVGVPEPNADPGAIGDLDSILLALQSGQIGIEQILPILFMLMQGGGAPGGAPVGPPPGPAGPIDQAFVDAEGAGLPPQGGGGGEIPPELLAQLGGGGF